jgi:ferrous iron transport protein B
MAQAQLAGDEEAVRQWKNREAERALEASLLGRVGQALTPVMAPLGFDWRISSSMLGAFAAKELFVAQLGVVYALGETEPGSESLRRELQKRYTPLVGFCIMLFALVSTPCMSTFAVTAREAGSLRWAWFQLLGLTALAWILTFGVFQIGRLLGL